MGESGIWEWLIPEYPSTEGDEDAINKMGGIQRCDEDVMMGMRSE